MLTALILFFTRSVVIFKLPWNHMLLKVTTIIITRILMVGKVLDVKNYSVLNQGKVVNTLCSEKKHPLTFSFISP